MNHSPKKTDPLLSIEHHGGILFTIFAVLQLSCGAGCNCKKADTSKTKPAELSTATSDASRLPPAPTTSTEPLDMVAVGRAYEYGLFDEAFKIISNHEAEDDKTQYLAAKVANAQDKTAHALLLLEKNIPATHNELQVQSTRLHIELLAKLKRLDEAITLCAHFLHTHKQTDSERRDMIKQMGDYYSQTAQYSDAISKYRQAKKMSGPKQSASISIQLGKALFATEQRGKAKDILGPLALKSKYKAVMHDAYQLLKKHHALPKWTVEQQLERMDQLVKHKSWSAALNIVTSLEAKAKGAFAKRLKWEKAQIFFSRRNHYKEALVTLQLLEKTKSPYQDDALFLKARALSRLDLDEKAIVAFRSYAKTTQNGANADRARFFAARLEYYLGKHDAALRSFAQLLGTHRKKKKTIRLRPDTIRDAHFLAGMSAFLIQKFAVAQTHFKAASKNSSNKDAIKRNSYWLAVAQLEQDTPKGQALLEDICREDATNWYALFAARRLQQKNVPNNHCLQLAAQGRDTAVSNDVVHGATTLSIEPTLPLEQISSKASVYASMGLFRPAANALREAEKTGKVNAAAHDWMGHYLQLSAPQYTIRLASNSLDWNDDGLKEKLGKAAYPLPYAQLVHKQEDQHGLPPFLIHSIARKESLFDPFARSYAGALGMMQMMPATYETNRKRAQLPKLRPRQIPNPAQSIVAGGFELAHLLEKFDSNLPLAIMAYNGGSKAVERWIARSGEFPTDVFVEKAGFAQTRNYVRRVYQNIVRYRLLYDAPLPILPAQIQ